MELLKATAQPGHGCMLDVNKCARTENEWKH
jgi:hypothetical protein